ncbi:MAG: hypothetical protein MJK04_12670 [Psychrosphaera sp.]|nr:hypothetical protein [Psychrosphaera sp.]
MSDLKRTKKGRRGKLLDPKTIRAYARTAGFLSFEAFERALLEKMSTVAGQTNTTAYNAWHGIPVDKGRAVKVAELLGLKGDYTQLQIPPDPAWLTLLAKTQNTTQFFELKPTDGGLSLFDLLLNDEKELDCIPLASTWHIQLQGLRGQAVMILLRSISCFHVLSPLNIAADFDNVFLNEQLYYPQKNIAFSRADGIGWREFIVIKADSIPFEARHPDQGFMVGIEQLEQMANQLLESRQKVVVGRYAFLLV